LRNKPKQRAVGLYAHMHSIAL